MSGNTLKLPESEKLQKVFAVKKWWRNHEEIMKKKKCLPHGNIYVSSIFEMNDNPKQRKKKKRYVTS